MGSSTGPLKHPLFTGFLKGSQKRVVVCVKQYIRHIQKRTHSKNEWASNRKRTPSQESICIVYVRKYSYRKIIRQIKIIYFNLSKSGRVLTVRPINLLKRQIIYLSIVILHKTDRTTQSIKVPVCVRSLASQSEKVRFTGQISYSGTRSSKLVCNPSPLLTSSIIW